MTDIGETLYVVFEAGAGKDMSYERENQFFNVHSAMDFAFAAVRRLMDFKKNESDCHNVMIYVTDEETFKQEHEIPCGEVIFNWCNYYDDYD